MLSSAVIALLQLRCSAAAQLAETNLKPTPGAAPAQPSGLMPVTPRTDKAGAAAPLSLSAALAQSGALRLVTHLRALGLIDGVGLQGHYSLASPTTQQARTGAGGQRVPQAQRRVARALV